MRSGVEDDGLHLGEARGGLAEEDLPLRVLEYLAPDGGAVIEVLVGPEVHGLVELPRLGLKDPDVLRVLLARRHDALEEADPLRQPADVRTVPAQLVDVAWFCRRLVRLGGREDSVLLRLHD